MTASRTPVRALRAAALLLALGCTESRASLAQGADLPSGRAALRRGEYDEAIRRLGAAAERPDATPEARRVTPRQVALRFLTRATTVFAIPKASSAEHADENAVAGDVVLTKDETSALDAAFPRGPKPRSLPML